MISLIACVSSDLGLGAGNDLLWRIPADLKWFRDTTMGATVVMGGRTFESIGKPLPGRQNIVLTRHPSEGLTKQEKCATIEVYSSKEALDRLLMSKKDEVFIIGGASLYAQYLPLADRLYLTEVAGIKPADVYFPEFDNAAFCRQVVQTGLTDDGTKYEMVIYDRK